MRSRKFSLGSQAVIAWMMTMLIVYPIRANPTGEQVAAGSASFDRSGSTLQITTSDRAIINWQDFSIGSGELTRFIQPSSSSAVLNRVISGNPSSILGTLESNGQVFLINPNGILVGGGAVINCGSFIASTLDVSNEEFLAGGSLKFSGPSQASIQNLGVIHATDGDVFLIAHHLDNVGTITADNGVVGLAAGNEVYLAPDGTDRLTVQLGDATASSGSGTGIINSGVIRAAQAELKATGNLYAMAVNNSGMVRASGAIHKNGRVILSAVGGNVSSSGIIEAKNHDGSGGAINVTGRSVAIAGRVDASGSTQGGTIRIGGEYQGGKNLPVDELSNAQNLTVARGAIITADGGVFSGVGDGGTVILWADQGNLVLGDISVRPGADAGAGGFVEVSSGNTLNFGGTVLTGRDGRSGTVLFDPKNITIAGAGADPVTDPFGTNPSTDYTISASNLETILSSPSSVILQANNDITVTTAINVNNVSGNGGDLTLQAGRSVLINADITTDNGNLTILANQGVPAGVVDAERDVGSAVIVMSLGTTLDAGTGDVHIVIGDGLGLANNVSGGMTLDNITAANIWLQTIGGPTSGSGIDRASPTSLLTANTGTFEVSSSLGGSIGDTINPLRVAMANVSAATTTGGGIYLESPSSGIVLGGAALGGLTGITSTGAFELMANGTISQVEDVLVAGSTTLNAGANDIILNGFSDSFGTLFLTGNNVSIDAGLVDLGTSTVTGNLTIGAGLDVFQSGPLTVGGNTLVGAGLVGNDIYLTDAGNAFTGTVTGQTDGDVYIVNTLATVLGGTVIGGSLDVTSGGNITQSGTLNVAGGTTLDAGVNDILLNLGNDFNYVDIYAANNATINDINDIGIEGTIFNNLILTAPGGIGEGLSLNVGGTGLFDAGSNDIYLIAGDGSNFFGSISLTGFNVTVDSSGPLTLGASTISGDLDLSSWFGIAQSGPISVAGTTFLYASSSDDILLGNPGNSLPFVDGIQCNNLVLNTSGALDFGGTTVYGSLWATANGPITQSSSITVSGPGAFFDSGGNDITLGNANDFISASFNGANIAVSDVSDLQLDPSLVSGNLTVLAGGNITQSGPLSIGSIAHFDASTYDVVMGDSLNNFNIVEIGSANNVTLNAASGIDLGASAIGGALNVTAGGLITQCGPLSITAGPSIFSAPAVFLMDPANSFSGTVAFSLAGDVALNNSGALSLDTSSVTGNLSLIAGGTITQIGTLTVGGASIFDSSGFDVTLNDPANDFNVIAFPNANNASVNDVNGITFDDSFIGGSLNVLVNGPINQGGYLIVSGTSAFDSGGNPMNLNNGGNCFMGSVTLNGGDTSLNSLTALDLGPSVISGSFLANSGGSITQSGALSVSAAAAFNSGVNNTILAGANSFGSIGVNANNATINVIGPVQVISSSVAGAYDLTVGGAITESGGVSANILTLNAGGAIDMTGGNSVAMLGNVTRGGAFSFSNSGSLDVVGNINSGSTANTVVIYASGDLILDPGANIGTSGAGNDVILVTGNGFINNTGGVPISTGGGRFLIYSVDPSLDSPGLIVPTFTENLVSYPTAPQPLNTGDGFLYAGFLIPDEPPIPPEVIADFVTATSDPTASTSDSTDSGGTTIGAIDGSSIVDPNAINSEEPVQLASNTDGTGVTDAGGSSGDGNLAGASSFDSSATGPTEPTGSSEPIGTAPGDGSVPAGTGMSMDSGGSTPLDGGQIPQSLQQGLDPQVQGDLQSAITSIDW